MIEALSPDTAKKPLTDSIGSRGVVRGFEYLNVTRLHNPSESHPKFTIVIPDEVLRPHPKSGGFPQLLCRPSVRRRACDADVDHLARVQFDNEEGKQRAKEEIGDRQEVARPDVLGMCV